jgi:hypothetical protein
MHSSPVFTASIAAAVKSLVISPIVPPVLSSMYFDISFVAITDG